MFGELPERIEPLQLARQGVTLEGELALAQMERLRDVSPPGGSVRLTLTFAEEDGEPPTLSGRFEATLLPICQRCMQPMRLPVKGEFRVALVADLDSADRLQDRFDVLPVGDRPLLLKTLVEDELLLAMPTVSLHPLDACEAASWVSGDSDPASSGGDRVNPFAVLAELRNRRDSE